MVLGWCCSRGTIGAHVRVVLPRALAVLTVLAIAAVQAGTGSATFTGSTKLAVKGCGTARDPFSAVVAAAGDGTWNATSPGEQFSGTYTTIGPGRRLKLTPDAATLANLTDVVVGGVSSLCRTGGVTVTSIRPQTSMLTLNRKLTRAKLLVRYVFAGTAGGRSGTATLTVRAAGPWTPQ